MLTALAEHLKSGKSSLQKVQFILYQAEAQKPFTDMLKKVTGL
jgi:hypothetical protein